MSRQDPTRHLQVGGLSLPNAAFITNTFDSVARLLSTTLKNSQAAILNSHQYNLNAASQRTRQTRVDNSYVDYTYDNAGELKTAFGKESGGVTNRVNEQFGYLYDPAGNLNWRTNNDLRQSFGVNSLNELTTVGRNTSMTVAGTTSSLATNVAVNTLIATQYNDGTFARAGFALNDGTNTFTAIAHDSYGRSDTNAVTLNLPASVSYSYDSNGNLTNDGRRIFRYDDENQLTSVIVTNGPGDSTLSLFVYDGKGRRRLRFESVWAGTSWFTNQVVRYVYDGNLVLQERDVNNVPTITYTRGKDLSGALQGAGGIGGLLARSDASLALSQPSAVHAYYHCDGNGNITALINTNQTIVGKYLYDPFGAILSQSGPLASANLYRFSSKEQHIPSGLTYYLYRYYDSNLQRWLNKDPIGERGGANLYSCVGNSPINGVDPLGLRDLGTAAMNLRATGLHPTPWGTGLDHFLEGVAVGGAATATVFFAAPAAAYGLTLFGVSAVTATATVDTTLLVAGGVGLGVTGVDTAVNLSQGNWNAVAFNAGNLVGGYTVGVSPLWGSRSGGRYLADKLGIFGGNGPSAAPELSPIDLVGALRYEWRCRLKLSMKDSDLMAWSASAPTPFSGGTAATGIASSIGSATDLVNQYGSALMDWLRDLVSSSSNPAPEP